MKRRESDRPDAGRDVRKSVAQTRAGWFSPAELNALERAKAKLDAGADPAIVAKRMGLSEARLRTFAGLEPADGGTDRGRGGDALVWNPQRGERGRTPFERPDSVLDNPFTRGGRR